MNLKLVIGMVIGFCVAGLFAPWQTTPRVAGKTGTCIEQKAWLMSKMYKCTPEEAEKLKEKQ